MANNYRRHTVQPRSKKSRGVFLKAAVTATKDFAIRLTRRHSQAEKMCMVPRSKRSGTWSQRRTGASRPEAKFSRTRHRRNILSRTTFNRTKEKIASQSLTKIHHETSTVRISILPRRTSSQSSYSRSCNLGSARCLGSVNCLVAACSPTLFPDAGATTEPTLELPLSSCV